MSERKFEYDAGLHRPPELRHRQNPSGIVRLGGIFAIAGSVCLLHSQGYEEAS